MLLLLLCFALLCSFAVPFPFVRSIQKLDFRHKLYALREERVMKPHVFAAMVKSMLYEKRFGPFFVEPLIAGLEDTDKEKNGQDTIESGGGHAWGSSRVPCVVSVVSSLSSPSLSLSSSLHHRYGSVGRRCGHH